jgi:hypothetical protein
MTTGKPRSQKTADARAFELLVAKIQQQLAPDAEVIHNTRIKGRITKRSRQIDVLVKQRIGQYEMLIVLECRDYKVPVDVNSVAAFEGFLRDVGAHKGVLVCPRGFTQSAKHWAVDNQIDLYNPIDTDEHKWQVQLSVPIVCDLRRAAFSFGLSSSSPLPFNLALDFYRTNQIFDAAGAPLGTALSAARTRWNSGQFPTEAGEHQHQPLFDTPTIHIDSGYRHRVEATLTASILVTRQLYFGRLPIVQMSGFRDELAGTVIAKEFTTAAFDINEVTRTWMQIASVNELPTPAMMTFFGFEPWPDEDEEG